MKTIRNLFTCLAFALACTGAVAASITARETAARSTNILKNPGANSSNWVHARTVTGEVQLSPQEIKDGGTVELYYCAIALSGRGKLANKTLPLTGKSSETFVQDLEFTGYKSWSEHSAWAARVIVGGKAIAWAGENDKALAWIKALPVEAKP